MPRVAFGCCFWILSVHAALASITITVDKVDPSDNITQPPAGIVAIDVLADVTSDDRWQAGGVRGTVLGGAVLRYAIDPNSGQPLLTDVGTANRFTTFFSGPRRRDSSSRYNSGGAAAAGRYCPSGPVATSTPTEVNVAYFMSPPEPHGFGVDGAVFRVALDISGTGHTGEEFVVYRLGEEPPGAVPYFLSDCAGTNPGTVAATFDVPQTVGFDWGLFIPEPANGAALVLAGLLLLSRRQDRGTGWAG